MNTTITTNVVKVNPEDPKFLEVVRSIHETDCRLSVLKSLISDPNVPENIAVKLSNEYVDRLVAHENLILDYIKPLASNECLKIANWHIDTISGEINISEEREVK